MQRIHSQKDASSHPSNFHAGTVAIIGRPNAGKSTLLNKIIGEKISIVTHKPQTTRGCILGIKTTKRHQIILKDTPGITRSHASSPLEQLRRAAFKNIRDVDLILYMVTLRSFPSDEDTLIINKLKYRNPDHTIILINKVDQVSKPALLPLIQTLDRLGVSTEIIPISARQRDGLDTVLQTIGSKLPVGPPLFPTDMYTDQPLPTMVAEIIREKVMIMTHQEIPYATFVNVAPFFRQKPVTRINATVRVERDSQRKIVIGKSGRTLKLIGSHARGDIERLLDVKVFLDLRIKSRKDWSKHPPELHQLGLMA